MWGGGGGGGGRGGGGGVSRFTPTHRAFTNGFWIEPRTEILMFGLAKIDSSQPATCVATASSTVYAHT